MCRAKVVVVCIYLREYQPHQIKAANRPPVFPQGQNRTPFASRRLLGNIFPVPGKAAALCRTTANKPQKTK